MRKLVNSCIAILVLILSIFMIPNQAFAEDNDVTVSSDFYVVDSANVFNDTEKTELTSNAKSLSKECNGIQLIISTVDTTGNDSIDSYAQTMYSSYGLDKDNKSILILYSADSSQICIKIGTSINKYISDSTANQFITNYVMPYSEANDIATGLLNLHQAIINEVIKNYNSNNKLDYILTFNTDLLFVFILIGLNIVLLIVFIFFLHKAKKLSNENRQLRNKLYKVTNKLNRNIYFNDNILSNNHRNNQ